MIMMDEFEILLFFFNFSFFKSLHILMGQTQDC